MADFDAAEYHTRRDAEDEMHARIMRVEVDGWVRIGKESRRVNRIIFLLWLFGLLSIIGFLAFRLS